MWNPKPLLLVISLCISALSPCTAATGGKPLVTAVTKDAATSLYTAPLKDGRPLVLDLSGPVISLTTCSSKNGTVTTLSSNATNGANPLFPVSFSAVASCAPGQPNLPAGAVGVAGLAPSTQSFLAQVARTQKVANKLALCLPSDGKITTGNSVGVAIYGGGPLIFPDRGDFTTMLAGTAPLVGFNGSPGYFISATGIAVEQSLAGNPGTLVVGLSTTAPYTALRPDVYDPFMKAFDQAATGSNFPWMTRVASVAPFERCYDSTKLPPTRLGYAVPQIEFVLKSGSNYSVVGGNSMVQVNVNTACLGFVKASGQAPAAIIGGFQMENRLLVLDAEKKTLGFTTFLNGVGLSCSNFNFTLAA
ncbi:hypothetical protein SETIT_4G169500v2 [Setaria italica]|uniref:Peptidase A1 domain-containing protein n=2 Tax=Setaria TaxID=4554 RepID=K3XXS7_SETIT|nr:basic 7S globulin [Setaria italica]RCV21831.1 hypothetical protein SETIT_4G169500v2 [Setaria italica]